MKSWIRLAAIAAVLLAGNLHAANALMTSTIERTLTTVDGLYGNCMALLDRPIGDATGLDCQSSWVTFSCSGDLLTKSEARALYDVATIALATDRQVRLLISDSQKHNGHCLATRIDLTR